MREPKYSILFHNNSDGANLRKKTFSELCKYYKNRNTRKFRIIPAIDDTYKTGKRQTLVTCLITIDEIIFQQMPKRESLTYTYLKKHHRDIYDDLNIFFTSKKLY